MLKLLWILLKLSLSCSLFAMAGFLLFQQAGGIFDDPMALFIIFILCVLALLPWQAARNAIGERGVGYIPLTMSVLFFVLASEAFLGREHFPHQCRGRSTALCHLINWIHEVGGDKAVAILYATASVILLRLSLKVFSSRRKKTSWP